MDRDDFVRQRPAKHVRHGLVGVVAVIPAADVAEDEVPLPEASAPGCRAAGRQATSRHCPGAVEVGRVDGTLAKADQPQHDLGPGDPEPDDPVVAFPHHDCIELARELGLAHTLAEDTRGEVLEDMAVDAARPLHQLPLVRALDRADVCHHAIDRPRIAEGEMFPEPLVHGERYLFGLQIHGSGNRTRCFCRCPVTLHRADLRETGLVHCTCETPADPEDRFTFAWDEQYPVLHRPGKIVEVDVAGDERELPAGVHGVHPYPETLQPVVETH